jgi:5,10-methylene-tetrahydrofolate dehydrogenase/methenyl tetrahydrofolate cyclohydrolase
VLVGENPASQQYVKMKRKTCEKNGLESFGYELPADASQAEVEGLVKQLNADPKVNGILVQLPLPGHLDDEKILNSISIEKDVDGSTRSILELSKRSSQYLFHAHRMDAFTWSTRLAFSQKA